jgi:hypothetical protein
MIQSLPSGSQQYLSNHLTTDSEGGRVKGVDRRHFMGSAAAAALAGAGLRSQRAAAHDAFSGYDGIGQAQLVRSKQATALELVDSAIARIEAANPKLNAVVWEMFEHARTRAKG